MDAASLVERFASALDGNDYATAAQCLAIDCKYVSGPDEVLGRDAVIAMYRRNSVNALTTFDDVTYSHRVSQVSPDEFLIHWSDSLVLRGIAHIYRCSERIRIDEQGRCAMIEHEELAGERQSLGEYMTRVGLSTGPPAAAEAG